MTEFVHVDDYLDSRRPDLRNNFSSTRARPAGEQDHAWSMSNRPFVDWRGATYRCVGASRLGDVWLKGDGPPYAFYDHRVNVAELSNWRRP